MDLSNPIFHDENAAREHLESIMWPDGPVCPHCGESSDPFGRGGAEAAARQLDVPFLGRIPLAMEIRVASDTGQPPAAGDSEQGRAFTEIAARLAAWLDGGGR